MGTYLDMEDGGEAGRRAGVKCFTRSRDQSWQLLRESAVLAVRLEFHDQ
jgi:hypothetical protein